MVSWRQNQDMARHHRAGEQVERHAQSALLSGLSFTALRRAVGRVPISDLSAEESA